jgi:hypothetical protein
MKILEKAIRFIIENNKGNYNSYHNYEHLLTVYNSVMEIAQNELFSNKLESNKTILELSSLFHDFNHLGIKTDDQNNIDLAIEGFEQFYNQNKEEITESQKSEIIRLIQSTKFPYNENSNDILINIIRDADMSSLFKDNFIFTGVFGLAKEFNIDIKQQVKNQIKFLNNIRFNTKYCIKKWYEIYSYKIGELIELDNLLT